MIFKKIAKAAAAHLVGPERSLLDLVERASGTQVKMFKNRAVTKKSCARPRELARPIENASVDILKLLEVNSTFARPDRATFRMVLLSFYL